MEEQDISYEQQQSYLQDPDHCPFCGSSNITAGHIDASGSEAYRDVQCLTPECRMTWTEFFALEHIDHAHKNK